MAAVAYLDNWIAELEASGTTADMSLPSTTGDDRAFLKSWIAELEHSTKGKSNASAGAKNEQAGGNGSTKGAGNKEGGKPGKSAKADAAAPKKVTG